ncbi:MAG TPA: DeoR/GlpR family DNA-binding transcription regulator [Acetobacteraceae bacterium]|nr:DeoR/GlpR family DNA-binding transcription regulator [Acetobacteraceae bacterium]
MKEGEQRRRRILAAVLGGMADVDLLSASLGVSASTVRRDLARLSAEGRILRTYGGAAPAGSLHPEQSLQQRAAINLAEKRAIARRAAGFIGEGETVILDAGTTTGALAAALACRQGLRVITNGLTAIIALAGAPGVELVLLGGRMRQISLGTVGSIAEHSLRRMTATRVFLGADGVVAGRGICEASDEQASLKELMIAQAGEIYVLADADKLGRATSEAWTPLSRPWTLITDQRASESQLAPFRRLGQVTIHAEPLTPAPGASEIGPGTARPGS